MKISVFWDVLPSSLLACVNHLFGRSCSFSTLYISKILLNIFRQFQVSLKIGEKTTNTLAYMQTYLSLYPDLDRNPLNFFNWNEASFLERTEKK